MDRMIQNLPTLKTSFLCVRVIFSKIKKVCSRNSILCWQIHNPTLCLFMNTLSLSLRDGLPVEVVDISEYTPSLFVICSEDGNKVEDDDPATPAAPGTPAAAAPADSPSMSAAGAKFLPFPTSSDLNTRVRRIISAYQKMSRRRAEAAAAAQERVCHVLIIATGYTHPRYTYIDD